MALLFAVRVADATELVELKRDGRAVDEWWFEALSRGAARGAYFDGVPLPELAGRAVATVLRGPEYLWQWSAYAAYLAFGERSLLGRLGRAITRRQRWSVQPLVVVVHDFMGREELGTPLGRERLVQGQLVPMCQLNATDMRRDENLELQRRGLTVIGASLGA